MLFVDRRNPPRIILIFFLNNNLNSKAISNGLSQKYISYFKKKKNRVARNRQRRRWHVIITGLNYISPQKLQSNQSFPASQYQNENEIIDQI